MPKNRRTSAELGQNRSTTAGRLRVTLLYKALNEIGRLEYPLDSVHLVSRQAIVDSPAVLTQMGKDAGIEERAAYAAQLISDVIDEIQQQPDRHIAEAVFGKGDFGGMTVKRRVERISKYPYNISDNVYWKRRPDAIEHVLHRLRRPSPKAREASHRALPAERPAFASPTPESVLSSLAQAAARVQFSGMAALFVDDYIERLSPELASDTPSEYVWQCSEYLFYDFIDLLMAPTQMYAQVFDSFEEPPGQPDLTLHDMLDYTMGSEDGRETLVTLYTTLLTHGSPFSVEQCTEAIGRLDLFWLTDHMSVFAALSRDFTSAWRDWCRRIFFGGEHCGKPSGVELLVSKSAQIVDLIRRDINVTMPVEAEAQSLALKRLSIVYGVDEWTPFMDGEGLRVHALRFFERVSASLAVDPLIWYGMDHK